MAKIPAMNEKWPGEIGAMSLGKESLTVGGDKNLPFMGLDGASQRDFPLAGEVLDDISAYPEASRLLFGEEINHPVKWAQKWKSLGADMICLRLISTDPEGLDRPPEEAAALVKEIYRSTGLPLIVYGSGSPEKDAVVLTAVAEAMSGTRLILAQVEEDSYKTVSAAAIAHGHALLAFSNLDINLAKQMNILLSDFGVDRRDIVMDPLMAPLGMGLDYSYSVNERIRLAALNGDRMLQCPIICDASAAWGVGDATDENPALGDLVERGVSWEYITALSALMSGANIIIVRSPQAAAMLKEHIAELKGVQ